MRLTDKTILLTLLSVFAWVGCSEDPEISTDQITMIYLSGNIAEGKTFTFSTSDKWSIEDYEDDKISLSETSGHSGTSTIEVTAKQYNNTGEDLSTASFTIVARNHDGKARMTVDVWQKPALEVINDELRTDPFGGTFKVRVNSDNTLNSTLGICIDDHRLNELIEDYTFKDNDLIIKFKPNDEESDYSGRFHFTMQTEDGSEIRSREVIVKCPSSAHYSKDLHTRNGIVTQLLTHSKGRGIPIILLGDGFLDKDIANGAYRAMSLKAMKSLFELHPMSHLKEYFDVYEVTAVSLNDFTMESPNTAFGCEHGTGVQIYGNHDMAEAYALKAIDRGRLIDASIVVMLNEDIYAGVCRLNYEMNERDIPQGDAISYLPLYNDSFLHIINHEAVGHGFAKLADEYDYDNNQNYTFDAQEILWLQKYGVYRNISIYNDITKTYWAEIAADPDYAHEFMGCFEGAHYISHNIWRSTFSSIMRDSNIRFNAIGRQMIYKRCMDIAYGDEWHFDYAQWKAFDLPHAHYLSPLAIPFDDQTRTESHPHTDCVVICNER